MRVVSIITSLLFSMSVTNTTLARETLVFAMSSNPPYHNKHGTGFLDRLEREALNRAGFDVRFDTLPGERALLYANQGLSDGEGDRIKGIDKIYTNLVMVDEPTIAWDFVAFSNRSDIIVDGWTSIQPYSVGLVNGWKILEYNTEDVQIQTKVKDIDLLFKLLKNKRADLVLMEAWQGLHYLSHNPIANVKLLNPPLVTKEKFMYLHKKHANIAPKVAAALREMKADGSYQKIVDQVLSPLIKQ